MNKQTEVKPTADTEQIGLSDLLCCPFCGNDAHIMTEKEGYKAVCNKISCVVLPPMPHEHYTSREQAIKVWNSRATERQG